MYLNLLRCLLLLLWTAVIVHCQGSCVDRNGCSERGKCVSGVCQCEPGSTGAHCETGFCYQRDTPNCVEPLVMAACRALNMTTPHASFIPPSCRTLLNPGPLACNPPMNMSCLEIHRCFPSAPSGNYRIQPARGSAVQVYCDMEGTNCGGEEGWTRVADINMAEPGTTCPQGLTQRALAGLTLCGRSTGGCQSTKFSTLGLNYSQVCGRIRGYQYDSPDAFIAEVNTINGPYVDGVSITYGSNPRRHIWTYACGQQENTHRNSIDCPCNSGTNSQVPSFVGSNYYCESAADSHPCCNNVLFNSDPLWDGQQCDHNESPCCSNHPNLPWFNTTLVAPTNENIELRVCGDQSPTTDEDTPLQLIELFVR